MVTLVTCMQKAPSRISAVSMSYLTHFYGCIWSVLNNAQTYVQITTIYELLPNKTSSIQEALVLLEEAN
jgi:hypothetical protein